jgi:hypothetical protein
MRTEIDRHEDTLSTKAKVSPPPFNCHIGHLKNVTMFDNEKAIASKE